MKCAYCLSDEGCDHEHVSEAVTVVLGMAVCFRHMVESLDTNERARKDLLRAPSR